MNQHIVIEYPCGCWWAFPTYAEQIPRNCSEYWPADKGFKLEDEEPSDDEGLEPIETSPLTEREADL